MIPTKKMYLTDVSEVANESVEIEKRVASRNLLSKDVMDKRFAEWQVFMLNNLDIFIEDILGIKLKEFQRQIVLEAWENEIYGIVACRGLSKTFTIMQLANALALLLPTVKIGIATTQIGQSNRAIDEYIDKKLCNPKTGISPIMQQLRLDGWIKFKDDKTNDQRVCEYGNGATVRTIAFAESSRGARFNIILVDEVALAKRQDYEKILKPMREPYRFKGLELEPKTIFMTSARTKDNWFYKFFKQIVRQHYKNKVNNYGFFAGDIFTAVANGILTKKQYLEERADCDEFAFAQERLNIWLGEKAESLFRFEQFHRCQTLKKAFIPPCSEDVFDGKEIDYEYKDDELRYVAMDIAVVKGAENDRTAIILGNINKNTGHKKVEYVFSVNGMNSMLQAIIVKRLFYQYKAQYFVYDNKGLGNVFYDILTVPTDDVEFGETYPAWTICRDKALKLVSNEIYEDKVTRTLDSDAKPVAIPVVGSVSFNSDIFISLRKNLESKNVSLLVDVTEKEYELGADSEWLEKSPENKALDLEPFLQTHNMINEAVMLTVKIAQGNKITVSEEDTKDIFMCLCYFNHFGNLLFNRLQQLGAEDEEEEFKEEDFLEMFAY